MHIHIHSHPFRGGHPRGPSHHHQADPFHGRHGHGRPHRCSAEDDSHQGHGGRGPRGGHPGHPGHGGHGGRGGHGGHPGRHGGGRRPLGRGDLRLLLLAQIEQQPRHGYELIRLIGDLFNGVYVPSPGVVYPTLALLEDLGWIAADQDDGRKRYRITDAGRAQADAEREAIDEALARTHASARQVAKASLPAPVRAAMHQLTRTLMRRMGHWTDAEGERVAQLLAQATDAIDTGERRD
ncbi:PadR family transcriptional regulator [Flavobacterium sp. MXW15]|uniref:PadR family transcriptional regulator n=1 Tax=Xanthomonas chitinilytica TaxID=2989819 RepID=A0ABT3JWY0_9XANT|nr:PadR family transcriptional regulator [Xanthomonas sp. H13-6]MCW4455765.1 PadR family transcriptional regulator [Flavobacterium sp. MXW15]MCW4472981.1 PadR family transcriptional regulator [Xanthomonas sp. H13-6]